MKKQFIIFNLIILIGIISSCDNSDEILYDEIPVVEAYLYTNQSLDSIKIVKVLNYYSDADTNILINNLDVSISTNDQSYIFKQSEGNPEKEEINALVKHGIEGRNKTEAKYSSFQGYGDSTGEDRGVT